MILFFFLAGASLDLRALENVGLIGMIYIAMRIVGRVIGARLGAAATGAEPAVRRRLGMALLPQAGISVGLGLLASQQLPELAPLILPVVLGSTVLFELIGPVATKAVLTRSDPKNP